MLFYYFSEQAQLLITKIKLNEPGIKVFERIFPDEKKIASTWSLFDIQDDKSGLEGADTNCLRDRCISNSQTIRVGRYLGHRRE